MNPIQRLINPTVVEKTRYLAQITASVRSRLPNTFSQRCWVSNLRLQVLYLAAENAEICSHIRHHQHEILKQVNEEFGKYLGQPVTKLRLKVDSRIAKVLTQKEAETVGYNKPTEKQSARARCSELLEIIRRAR